MLKDKFRKGEKGESEEHGEKSVDAQELVDSNVVLRVAAEVVRAQQIEERDEKNTPRPKDARVQML